MAFVDATADKILNKILKGTDFTSTGTLWCSLHTADPAEDGSNECTGGSYTRQTVTFLTATAGTTSNTGALTWTDMPTATVTHVGLFSASSGGTWWWGGALSTSKAVAGGDTFSIAVGDLDVTLT